MCKFISVWAMYMALLNLPRGIRFLRENMMLVWLIPAFTSEPKHLNDLLRPVESDLLMLWTNNGITMKIQCHSKGVKVRAALMMVYCDIPAARKVCGFPGYSTRLGCSNCLKTFWNESGQRDCLNFQKDSWPKCSVSAPKSSSRRVAASKTKSKSAEIIKASGYNDTILLQHPYHTNACYWSPPQLVSRHHKTHV